MYLTKTVKLEARKIGFVELNSEKSQGFKPLTLQIKVNDERDPTSISQVEICNIYSIGNKSQLVNNDGITNVTSRGNTFLFNSAKVVDFYYIYPKKGEGLTIEFYNYNHYDVEIHILISGEPVPYPYHDKETEIRYLFKSFEISPKSLIKVPLRILSYESLFSVENLQIVSFKKQ